MHSHGQETLKRRWHDTFYAKLLTPTPPQPQPLAVASSSAAAAAVTGKQKVIFRPPGPRGRLPVVAYDDPVLRNLVPAVTVVVEGRSICHRINLHHHHNYHSLAKALRHLFRDHDRDHHDDHNEVSDEGLDLSNAIPGHLVAYEDLENDLLLAGDLSWKDFVRVAKRIRILPIKSNSRMQRILNNWSKNKQLVK